VARGRDGAAVMHLRPGLLGQILHWVGGSRRVRAAAMRGAGFRTRPRSSSLDGGAPAAGQATVLGHAGTSAGAGDDHRGAAGAAGTPFMTPEE